MRILPGQVHNGMVHLEVTQLRKGDHADRAAFIPSSSIRCNGAIVKMYFL